MAGLTVSSAEAGNTISNTLVSLYKEYYGKGPTKAKAYLLDEAVVCILQGGMTQAEKTLTDEGQEETVHEVRHSWQQVMEDRFKNVIEETLGRRVEAYIGGVDPEGDASAELFLLEDGTNASSHNSDSSA
jgi:uncharacterized protein YbcI